MCTRHVKSGIVSHDCHMTTGVQVTVTHHAGTISALVNTSAMNALNIFTGGNAYQFTRFVLYSRIVIIHAYYVFGFVYSLLFSTCVPCSNKAGNVIYNSWCTLWERESGECVAPGAKMFLVDQYLPIWVQCTLETCLHWRKLPPAIELHHVKQDIVKCSDCSRPEDEVGVACGTPPKLVL